jgi:hypothetical protein
VVLLAGVRLIVPVMGVVVGVAAMLGARVERLKLRVETLKKSVGWRSRGGLLMRRTWLGAWWKRYPS